MTRMWMVAVSLCLALATGHAKPLALEAHDVGTVSVSTPRGWAFTGDAAKGMAVARQDPSRKDGAQLLVMVSTTNTATVDQILDTVTTQLILGSKVVKREARGTGKLIVADGTTEGIRVRLGAIAIGSGTTMVVGLLIAKTGDFDGLGGTDLVASVMASLKASEADQPTVPAPAPAPTAAPTPAVDAVMPAQYDEYHTLIIPPPARALGLADLAGVWSRDDTAAGSHGASNGGENWAIDAKGAFYENYRATVFTTASAYQASGKNTGRAYIDRDGTFVIARDGKPIDRFIIRGWFVGADKIILRLNGPYRDAIAPQHLANPSFNRYMNRLYVKKAGPT